MRDPIVAGLLLLHASPSPDSPLRQQLLTLSLTHPAGAFLAAESLHVTSERPAIIAGLQQQKQFNYWTSLQQSFRHECLAKANSDYTLWAGLTVLKHAPDREYAEVWLKRAAETACHVLDAAAACLVLQPHASPDQQAVWLDTLKCADNPGIALECVRWAQHTWERETWTHLKNQLHPIATGDRGFGWFHWPEPDWCLADYQHHPVQPLWSLEFLTRCYHHRQVVDDRPLRSQMVERLVANHGDPLARLVLRYLDALKEGKIPC